MLQSKIFTELYFSAKYVMLKGNTGIRYYCSGLLTLGSTEIDNADKCAAGVIANTSCGNTFFYAPRKGWCKCEKEGFSCPRWYDDDNYNEYRIVSGS